MAGKKQTLGFRMALGQQILWGSMYLGACLVVEIFALVLATSVITRYSHFMNQGSRTQSVGLTLLIALVFIVLAHTLQAWVWAAAWVFTDAIEDWNTAIYFSLVSYSTLGYGDIVLEPGLRVFGAFSAVTGILAFGVSTAYLVAITSKSLEHISPDRRHGSKQRRK